MTKKKCFLFISLLLFTTLVLLPQEYTDRSNGIKVLVLVIASDNAPIYRELQTLWRSYMHYDQEHIEAYFIKANPTLPSTTKIQDDIIWSKSSENIKPGILNKTILSMEAMLPRLQEFDYILRTNLSTFYIFPRLLKFLKTQPKKEFYCAVPVMEGIGNGAFIITPDILELLVSNKNYFLNNATSFDDIVLGTFLKKNGIKLVRQARMDFPTIATWYANKNQIPNHIFNFRLRNSNPYLRIPDEIYIYSELIKMFYS